MADDDDGGTTTETPATDDTSGDPSVSPTTSPMSSASSGEVFDTTGAPETTGIGGDSSSSGSTTGPPPRSPRVDLFPRACDTETMWESHLGETSCIEGGDANGVITTHLDKGRFKRVISARPPTTDGDVLIRGRFPDLSLDELVTPVLRGQAACSADEKCEANLVIRIRDPYSDAEQVHTETLVGGEPVDFAIPLEGLEAEVVEVVLQASSFVSLVSGESATAVLWSDVHIAG